MQAEEVQSNANQAQPISDVTAPPKQPAPDASPVETANTEEQPEPVVAHEEGTSPEQPAMPRKESNTPFIVIFFATLFFIGLCVLSVVAYQSSR
ncbi:MAG: hypothetical protein QG629_16 [Patescibacteria group bacterium]|nr:hypothetical protein [Candidatus Saccharibacteria bacterium]MDQ5962934.1 hypothetical protein [Patescibacteria group bacterium]